MSSTTSAVAQELSTRKIGPVIISFSGTKLTDKEQQLLANPNVGGVVLFRENWEKDSENPKTALKAFIASCRAINPNLIFMVDHEGGKIWRFVEGATKISSEESFTRIPSAKSIGLEYDQNNEAGLQSAYKNGYIMASELLACGVDCSLAPVMDLDGPSNVIGKLERAFHKNPFITAKLTEAFIQGMNAAGMRATAKHFPGHGTCLADSHTETPVDDRPIEKLVKDLFPFRENIRKHKLGAVMPAHVIYPAVDPNHPAGFSSIWIQSLLRNRYGFDGVVMSDCLSMAGATVGSGSGLDRLLAAQRAGCDFLMLTHQHNTPDHPDPNKRHLLLDHLLSVIDTIPDTPDAARRRAQFALGPNNADFARRPTQFAIGSTPQKAGDLPNPHILAELENALNLPLQSEIKAHAEAHGTPLVMPKGEFPGTIVQAQVNSATTTTQTASQSSAAVSPTVTPLRDAKESSERNNQQRNAAQAQSAQPVRSVLNTI